MPEFPPLNARALHNLYAEACARAAAPAPPSFDSLPEEDRTVWATFTQLVRDHTRKTQP